MTSPAPTLQPVPVAASAAPRATAAFKTCTCCGLAFTAAGWAALPIIGLQPVKADPLSCDCIPMLDENGMPRPDGHAGNCDSRARVLEMRNCPAPCISTLTVTVWA